MAEYEVLIKRTHNGSSATISKTVKAEDEDAAVQKALDICLENDTMGDDYELVETVEMFTEKYYFDDDGELCQNYYDEDDF